MVLSTGEISALSLAGFCRISAGRCRWQYSDTDPSDCHHAALSTSGSGRLNTAEPDAAFPPKTHDIIRFREVLDRFKQDVLDASRCGPLYSTLENVTEVEIDYLRQARAFGKACSSLFSILKDYVHCQDGCVARLHLSGFSRREMEMLLGTDEGGWVSACFAQSQLEDNKPLMPARSCANITCPHTASVDLSSQLFRYWYDETGLWQDHARTEISHIFPTASTSLTQLHGFLRSPGHELNQHVNGPILELYPVERKIIGVFLACSLLQLFNSPWLQYQLEAKNVLLQPRRGRDRDDPYENPLQPQINCDLNFNPSHKSLADDVAALGVLVLELEAERTAGWESEDEDFESGKKTNQGRLWRILRDWKHTLPDAYRDVGRACREFEATVGEFEQQFNLGCDDVGAELRVLYKRIVNPLYLQLVTSFGEAQRLFHGVPGLSVPKPKARVSSAQSLFLYDDFETTECDEKSGWARGFMDAMEIGFLQRIRALRMNPPMASLANSHRLRPVSKPIRIAVLDTGIDPKDPIIRQARRMLPPRIAETKSWVGKDEIDTDGHGTHVTRLLLRMAPTAHIYVAKITDGKRVASENMSCIAEAIAWAVKKDVDIISMSFGYQDENEEIDDAIDLASAAGKLMFAAASNEGGNKKTAGGRSRPGRDKRVICIHACDGKGNKGGMNPGYLLQDANFITLGVAVESLWKGKTVYKSGTSFATPVAAAIAADVLEISNIKCDLSKGHRKKLREKYGMEAVLQRMAVNRDHYDYINPDHLWDGCDDQQVAEEIQKVLKDL